MLLKAIAVFFFVASASVIGHNVPDIPSFIPKRPVEPHWKAPKEYLEMRDHIITTRDHGCVELKKVELDKSFTCVNIWLKNRFSVTQVKPSHVFLDFQHHGDKQEDAYKPTVTWVENVNPWRIRGCVAQPGGKKNSLEGGKLRWLAIYNTQITEKEQFGSITSLGPLTTNTKCIKINFPKTFSSVPTLKFTVRLRYGLLSARDAMVVWAKGITPIGATVCAEEFYGWSRYHNEIDIQWYGLSGTHNEDFFSEHSIHTFAANEQFPADHKMLNYFYCKNVTLNKWHYPCPAVLVQAVEPNTAVCESALVAWVAYLKHDKMTICYADKRGIMGIRKTDVQVHVTIYGSQDKCQSKTCPANQECTHPSWDTVTCGCYKKCPDHEEHACGSNMKTYKNKCYLEKAACESGFKFSYAHHGKCEALTFGHGRQQLQAVASCEGLYCANISTVNRIWYADAPINVQISTNWMSDIDGQRPTTHDATASWVEDVKPNSFKACVMEAGRKTLSKPPSIDWFAYQGEHEKVMTRKIEVGEWKTGTHCVPLHERTVMEKPHPHYPPKCPEVDVNTMNMKVNKAEEMWHYDSSLMSKIYGQAQSEWFKRMMSGYGVKQMKMKSGMHLNGATLMLTVEQSMPNGKYKNQDAVNVWMEYDGASKEAYVCLREMQNWDSSHKGINVHWTLFMDKSMGKNDVWKNEGGNMKSGSHMPSTTKAPMSGYQYHPDGSLKMDMSMLGKYMMVDKKMDSSMMGNSMMGNSMMGNSMMGNSMMGNKMMADKMMDKMKSYAMMASNDFGFVKSLKFKPALKAPEENGYAFCQVQQYLPMNFSKEHDVTVFVTLSHLIPKHAAFESMKKYRLHQEEVKRGMPMGDISFNSEREQPSWMMPHMWRANLTGWRPHMRISKNTDYSVWVEGKNDTHIRVCQKSIFNGYYEGVTVNLVILPKRCKSGYYYFRRQCVRASAACDTYSNAKAKCELTNDKFVAPKDAIHNVFYSYLANQDEIYVARNDLNVEGTWKREDGEKSNYTRWAKGEPKSSPDSLDCSIQSGRSKDFTERAASCSECKKYICAKPVPQLSCKFPHDYCHHGGMCNYEGPGKISCKCTPPYKGERCEIKM